MSWWVYVIVTQKNQLYTGITTDPKRRWIDHLSSPKGAKFFRSDIPLAFAYLETCENRSQASVQEYQIKQLNRQKKLQLINASSNATQSHYQQLALYDFAIPLHQPCDFQPKTTGGR